LLRASPFDLRAAENSSRVRSTLNKLSVDLWASSVLSVLAIATSLRKSRDESFVLNHGVHGGGTENTECSVKHPFFQELEKY
jgi:hypothetical protein